jgi:hypothetical protein
MPLRYNAHATSGTLDTLVAGTVTGGTAVEMGDNARQKVRNLSALVTVDAETSTITISGKWQVSNDGSTWVDVTHGTQNAAAVVLATGTAGADAAVTRAFEAPSAVYGWRKARFAITNGVVTGNAVDTYAISYSYRTGA